MRNRLLTIALVVAVHFLAFAVVADENQVGLLDRSAVIEAAAEVTAEAYPNADDVLVDARIRSRYRADGTSESVNDTFIKVLTEKGRRDLQTLSFHFNRFYGGVALDAIEVIKPDGSVMEVDVEENSRVMADREQLAKNIFNPESRILRVSVPGLEVGDMLRYVSSRETRVARVPDTWSDYRIFEYTSPLRRVVYEVTGPQDLPLRSIALKDEVAGTVTHAREEADGLVHYRWEARDVPRMFEEPSMPPLHNVVQRLLVSTVEDWEDISQWYWELSLPRLETTPEMERKVAELIEGVEDRREQIEALFTFNSQEVRYVGITAEEVAPGYEPRDVAVTFENRYGVCRDKAALLVAMLRIAGFEAFPVLIHMGPRKDEEVPQPYFNHAITAVLEPDGSYLLMDPTDENTKELLPAYLGNKSYLVARPEGDTLRTSYVDPAEQNLVHVSTEARLSPNGALRAETTLRFDGINDNAYRGYFARIAPEQRRRFFESAAKRVLPGARLVDLRVSPADMRDVTQPLEAVVTFEALDVPVQGRNRVMTPLPLWGARLGMANFILGKTGLEERKYPLVTDYACGVRETLSLDLGEAVGAPVSLPGGERIEHPGVEWRREIVPEEGRLTVEGEFLLTQPEFSPGEYLTLKQALKDIEYQNRKTPVFARAEAAADPEMEILESSVVYDVGDDPTEWTETRRVKKRVLTYAGIKDHSEIKVDYNPAWEEVEVVQGVVTGPDGSVHEISDREINLFEAEWAGTAPRYPAGKTLVANLPGVGVGSVIEYSLRRTRRDRPFFQASEYFRSHDPVRRKRVEILASDGVREGWSLASDVPSDGEAAWEAAGQPGVERESQLPPWWSFNPHLFVSTGQWDAYAAPVRRALESAAADADAARERARSVVDGAVGEEAALRVRDFVARNIRLDGPDLHEVPLSAITPADRTLESGYGNSADRAALLAAMLREAGFEPRFVLASWERAATGLRSPRLDAPDTSLFPRVLVAVDVLGETVYLNDGDQYAALGATAHDGCYGLDLGAGEMFVIRADDAKRDRRKVEYEVRIDEQGAAEIARTERYYGGRYADFHRRAVETTAEERRRYQLELAAGISQAAEIVEPLEQRYDTYPGEESLRVRVERYAVADGPLMYLRLPGEFGDLFRILPDTRANPLYWNRPVRTTVAVRVFLPEGFRSVELAPPQTLWRAPGEAGIISVETQQGGEGELLVTYRAELGPAVIEPAEYGRVLDIAGRLSHAGSHTVMVERE